MGQIISSSKLFKYSFNIFLEDSFFFPLRRLGGDSWVGEDKSCTTLVDLTSESGTGERLPLLPPAREFEPFTPSWGSPANRQR